MLGTLRLLLASFVVISHADISAFGYHLGVPAVVVFYVLAGYVVDLQWRSLAARAPRPVDVILPFFRDRAMRLLPVYAAALLLAAVVAWFVRPDTYFLSRGPDGLCILANLAIVPLDYFQVNGTDHCSLIPVAWSLGLEIQFYILFPLLALNRRLMLPLAAISLAIFVVANAGGLWTDMWGYRLLPGTLFIFLIGVALAESERASSPAVLRHVVWASSAFGLLSAVLVLLSPQATTDFAFETSVGLLLAIPLIAAFKCIRRSRLDDVLGRAAYPLFLVHFSVLWVLRSRLPDLSTSLLWVVVYVASAYLVAFVLAWSIDRPLGEIRRRLRTRVGDAIEAV